MSLSNLGDYLRKREGITVIYTIFSGDLKVLGSNLSGDWMLYYYPNFTICIRVSTSQPCYNLPALKYVPANNVRGGIMCGNPGI